MDYRQSAGAHPAVCIDTKYASFLDDAFSLSPETGELLIHVVDVVSAAVVVCLDTILFVLPVVCGVSLLLIVCKL